MKKDSESIKQISTKEELSELYESINISYLDSIKTPDELKEYIESLKYSVVIDQIDTEEVMESDEFFSHFGIDKKEVADKMLSLFNEIFTDLGTIQELITEKNVEELKRLLEVDYSAYYYTYINYYDENMVKTEPVVIDDSNRPLFREFIDQKINEMKEFSTTGKKPYTKKDNKN